MMVEARNSKRSTADAATAAAAAYYRGGGWLRPIRVDNLVSKRLLLSNPAATRWSNGLRRGGGSGAAQGRPRLSQIFDGTFIHLLFLIVVEQWAY